MTMTKAERRAWSTRVLQHVDTHPERFPPAPETPIPLEPILQTLLPNIPPDSTDYQAIVKSLMTRRPRQFQPSEAKRDPRASHVSPSTSATPHPQWIQRALHHFGETLQIPNPEDVADALSQRIVRDAQNSATGKADMARRAAAGALIAVAHDLFSTDHALSSSPTIALANDLVDGDSRAHLAFVQAFPADVGRARLSTWITAVRASHGAVLTRCDQTRAHAAQRRVTTQAEAVVHHRAAFQSLRIRLDALGIDQPLTYETLRHLLQMLPDRSSTIPSPAAFVQCGGSPYDPKEPAWVRESPGPDRVLASDPAISDDVLTRAWFDQWITTATISQHLAISRAHAADSKAP